MDIVIETDIGRDADDFFALLYLIGAGVTIRGIVVSPGDPDQMALLSMLLKVVKRQDIPYASHNPERKKQSISGFHADFIRHYDPDAPLNGDWSRTDRGVDLLEWVYTRYPDTHLFAIGPLKSVGEYLASGGRIPSATMQGGFLGYDVHGLPCTRLEKFEGLTHCPTFNLGGDQRGAELFLGPQVGKRQFIGKNVCHAIFYNRAVNERICAKLPDTLAGNCFREWMTYYLKEKDGKMFHDPAAAVCMLHPEIATWVKGKLERAKGAWGTVLHPEGDDVAAVIDEEALWDYVGRME